MEGILFTFWGLWLLLVVVAAVRVFIFLITLRSQEKRWGDGSSNQESAAVIVAVKGFDQKATPAFFDALFSQDYSNYRVLVTFESWQDPVAVWLLDQLELSPNKATWSHPDPSAGLRSISLICAGESVSEGQKVHNQRVAFEQLTESDRVIAFADGDISMKSNWLALLTAPINQRTHPLATTYRWLVPRRPSLANQVASVINASITTQGGSEGATVLWGGSMAIARSVFDELDTPNLFAGSLNDDLRLSKAAREIGKRPAFVCSLIAPTSIDFTWRSFIEFGRRQYTQVKIFSPILYRATHILMGFYSLGIISLVLSLIYGAFYAWVPIAAAYVIDQFRSLARQQIYLSLFPEIGIRRKLFSASWLEHMLTPLWMLIHWGILLSTLTQRKLTWAGIEYEVVSPTKMRVLKRSDSIDPLPVSVPGLALMTGLHDRQRGMPTEPIRVPQASVLPDRQAAPSTEPIEPVSEPATPVETPSATELEPSAEPVPSGAEDTPATPPPATRGNYTPASPLFPTHLPMSRRSRGTYAMGNRKRAQPQRTRKQGRGISAGLRKGLRPTALPVTPTKSSPSLNTTTVATQAKTTARKEAAFSYTPAKPPLRRDRTNGNRKALQKRPASSRKPSRPSHRFAATRFGRESIARSAHRSFRENRR